MSDKEPGTLVAAKNSSPLVVGLGDGENFVASDVTAILAETRKVIFLDEGEIVTVTRDGVDDHRLRRQAARTASRRSSRGRRCRRRRAASSTTCSRRSTSSRARSRTRSSGRVDLENDDVTLDGIELDVVEDQAHHLHRVRHLVPRVDGRRVPRRVARAHPGRGRPRARSSAIAIRSSARATSSSRSASRARRSTRWRRSARPRRKGAQVLAISNVVESSIPRLSDYAFYTHAGPEIGVASTKAFTTQLVAIALLAIHLGRRTGTLSTRARARCCSPSWSQLPNKMRDVVEQRRAAPGARAALRRGHTAFCSSAAARSTRSRSRARSSSRRSRTSTPRATPPAR